MALDYTEHTWGYGEEFTPDKLNNMEHGIKAASDAVNEVNNNLSLKCNQFQKGFNSADEEIFFSDLTLAVVEKIPENGSIAINGAWTNHFYFSGLFMHLDDCYYGHINTGVNLYTIAYKINSYRYVYKFTGERII